MTKGIIKRKDDGGKVLTEKEKFCEMIQDIVARKREWDLIQRKHVVAIIEEYSFDIPDILITQYFKQVKFSWKGNSLTCDKAWSAYEDYKNR